MTSIFKFTYGCFFVEESILTSHLNDLNHMDLSFNSKPQLNEYEINKFHKYEMVKPIVLNIDLTDVLKQNLENQSHSPTCLIPMVATSALCFACGNGLVNGSATLSSIPTLQISIYVLLTISRSI